ncbi:MAG: hypothetical protein U0165_19620 [Polyangiaceae bacterium]
MEPPPPSKAGAPGGFAWRATPPVLRIIEARPYDELRVERDGDLRNIRGALSLLGRPICIDARGPGDAEAFVAAARDPSVAIIHFDGHAIESLSAGGTILFEDRFDGKTQKVPIASLLSRVLAERNGPPVLLCFAACDSLPKDAAKGLTKKLKSEAVHSVSAIAGIIGFSEKIQSDATAPFFRRFYAELARGAKLGDAFSAAQTEHKQRGKALNLSTPTLATATPDWSLFDTESLPLGSLYIERDPSPQGRARELPEAFSHMRLRHAPALHRLLAAPPQEPTAITIVGLVDTGRSMLLRSVIQHVAHRYRAISFTRHDAREGKVTAQWLARRVLLAIDGEERIDLDDDPVGRARHELQRDTPFLLALSIDSAGVLADDGIEFLASICAPSAVVIVTPEPLDRLRTTTIQIDPLSRTDARTYFKSKLPKVPGWSEIVAISDENSKEILDRLGGHPLALAVTASQMSRPGDIETLIQSPVGEVSWQEYLLAALVDDKPAMKLVRAIALFCGSSADVDLRKVSPDAEGASSGKPVDASLVLRGERSERGRDFEVLWLHDAVRDAIDDLLGARDLAWELATLMSAHEVSVATGWLDAWRRTFVAWLTSLDDTQTRALEVRGLEPLALRLASEAYPLRSPPQTLRQAALSHDPRQYGPMSVRVADRALGLWGLTPRQQLDAAARVIDAGRLTDASSRLIRLVDASLSPLVAARVESMMAHVAWRSRGETSALRRFLKAVPALEDPSANEDAADALIRLAEIQRERGRLADSGRMLEQASLRLAQAAMQSPAGESFVSDVNARLAEGLFEHGATLVALGELEAAASMVRLARSNLGELATRDVLLNARLSIVSAELSTSRREYANADDVLREAHGRAAVQRQALLEVEIDAAWGRMLSRQGDARGAKIRLERATGRMNEVDAGGPRRLRAELDLARLDAAIGHPSSAALRVATCRSSFAGEIGLIEEALMRRVDAQIVASLASMPGEANPAEKLREAASRFLSAAYAYSRAEHRWRAALCHLDASRCYEVLRDRTRDFRWQAAALDALAFVANEFSAMGMESMRKVAAGRAEAIRTIRERV